MKVESKGLYNLISVSIYFNDWKMFDNIIKLIFLTLINDPIKYRAINFFFNVIKFYIYEKHYRNIPDLMYYMGEYMQLNHDFDSAIICYFNCLKYAFTFELEKEK